MDTRKFDQLTRFMARGTNRRGAMGALAISTLSGFGFAKGAHALAAAPGEEWVRLYESMAGAVDRLNADCGTVVQALKDWHEQHADEIARMEDELRGWTNDQRAMHQAAYSERVQDAAVRLQLSLTRCGYKPDSISPYTEADINSGSRSSTPSALSLRPEPFAYAYQEATPIAPIIENTNCPDNPPEASCDCLCDPGVLFTVGNCITFTFDCATNKSGQNDVFCCWSNICMAGFDHDQCVTHCEYCLSLENA